MISQPPGYTARICLIRHGLTIANEHRLYCGATDLPLSEVGKAQLSCRLADYSHHAVDRVFHSGLLRTRQTAELLFPAIEAQAYSGFGEFDFGRFEMKSHDDLVLDPEYQNWLLEFDTYPCPEGESRLHFQRRVLDAWQSLIDSIPAISQTQKPAGEGIARQVSIVLITHGGVIATLMMNLFPGQKDWYDWQPACGKGYCLEIESGKATRFSDLF